MASIAFPSLSKTVTVKDGTTYGYMKLEPKGNKPTLLFLHGYPSSSYHWHYQVKQCQDEGYGAIIPDLLGYGDTDKPKEFVKYDLVVMAKQVMDLLDHENVNTVVGIGHDWGSGMLSVLARHYPARFSLLVWMAVGYAPTQAPMTDIEAVNKKAIAAVGRPLVGYWIFHNTPEAASMLENADPESLNTLLFPADSDIWKANVCEPGGMYNWIKENKKTTLAPWMNKDDLAIHQKIMANGGYTGPLNWYKQAMAGVTAASEAHLTDEQRMITIPTLFIGTERDVIAVPALQESTTKAFIKDLQIERIDTGHWCMLEKPEETWALVDRFVKARL